MQQPVASGAGVPLDVVAAIAAALSVVLQGPVRIRSIQRLPVGGAASAPGPAPWALAGRMDQHLARRAALSRAR